MEPTMVQLQRGSPLTKVRGSNKYFLRFFRIDMTAKTITYDNSRKRDKTRNSYPFHSIEEIREGFQTETFQKCQYDMPLMDKEGCCFSLVFRTSHRTLDLMADDVASRDLWIAGLKYILGAKEAANLATHRRRWLEEKFKAADKGGDGSLTFKETMGVLKMLNVELDEDEAYRLFMAADTHDGTEGKETGVLDLDEFVKFYNLLTSRPEIHEIAKTAGDGSGMMDLYALKKFLMGTQHQKHVNDAICADLIQRHEPSESLKSKNLITVDGLNSLLALPEYELFNPAHSRIYHDMTQPLSHYYISTSHNTFLAEDQIKGPSSLEEYVRALRKGCRCVELDCQEGDDGVPVVYHKFTLTSKLKFEDIIKTVKRYAFESSQYPVVLSLEVHCSVRQQDLMADMLTEHLGDFLYLRQVDASMKELPSPERLRGKILVKGKKLPADIAGDAEVSDDDDDEEGPKEAAKKRTGSQRAKVKLSKKLSDLVRLCQSVHFVSFDHSALKHQCFQMCSFAEGKADDMAKHHPDRFVDYNKRHLSRIYPANWRQDSSNYDPIPFWNVGCQMVALNFQTRAEEMQMYEAKFMDNGGCGYLLKPFFMREPSVSFSPLSVDPKIVLRVSLTIISAQKLPKSKDKDIVDPFVRIHIHGVPADCYEVKTTVVKNNGLNPMWEESFDFVIRAPELAIMHFRVRDQDAYSSNDTVCQYAIPVMSMQAGYRHLRLRDKNNIPLEHSTLFIRSRFFRRTKF